MIRKLYFIFNFRTIGVTEIYVKGEVYNLDIFVYKNKVWGQSHPYLVIPV